MNTKEITIIAACISILFIQEQVLMFIPNFMFTTVLIVIYSKIFSFKKSCIIVFVHVFLDNLLLGSLTPTIFIPMLIAWLIIPLSINSFLHNENSEYKLAIYGYIYGHIYGWIFIPFQVFTLNISWSSYLVADIPFEIIMGISNYLTILYLYKPLKNQISNLLQK